MKKIFTLVYLFCISGFLNAQIGWHVLNSGTTTINFSSLCFINANTGIVVGTGSGQNIYKTTNGGINWTIPYTSNTVYFEKGVSFPDSLTGYVVGYSWPYTTSAGVVMKSTDGGNNWFINYIDSSNNFIYCYFANANTGYITGGFVVKKTTNGGSNWITLTSIGATCGFFFNANTGFIDGPNYHVRKTFNGGITWDTIQTMQLINAKSIFFTNSNTGYIHDNYNNPLIKTTNGGINWFGVSNFPLHLDAKNMISFRNDTVAFLIGLIDTGSMHGSILVSTNAGVNWRIDTAIVPDQLNAIQFPNPFVAYAVGNSGTIVKKIFSAPNAILKDIYRPNEGRIEIAYISLSDSLSSGIVDSIYWYVNDSLVGRQHTINFPFRQGTNKVKLKLTNNYGEKDSTVAKVTRIAYKKYTSGQIIAGESLIGDSVYYLISTNDAVYRMDILGNFLYTLQATGTILSSSSISFDTNVYIGSGDNNLYAFNKYGLSLWAPFPLGGAATCTPTIDSISNRVYLGVSNNNFIAVNRQTGTSAWIYNCTSPIKSSAVISYDRKLVFTTVTGKVYGINLASPPNPSWTLQLSDSVFTSPAIDDQGYFYIGTKDGKVFKITMPAGLPASIVWQCPLLSSITSSPTIDSRNNLYVGTNDGKFYSIKIANGSVNWYFQTNGTIRSTASINSSGRIFFGNDAGEVYGLDTNKNVKFYFLDSTKISCAMLYKNGTLNFGNEWGRVYSFYDTTLGVYDKSGIGGPIWGTFQNNLQRTGSQSSLITKIKQVNENLPLKYALYQNYPNPFNPDTKIKFSIPKNEYLTLKIYDVLGRMVKILISEKLEAGEYELRFLNSQLSSGVYFYKMQAGNYEQVKKMVIFK